MCKEILQRKFCSNAIYFVILAKKFPALQDPIFDLFIDMEVGGILSFQQLID